MAEQIQKIGNYVLLEKLAVGGMAEVYLGKIISSDKLVAIKKVRSNHASTNEYVKLFKEEIKVSLNLKHGNIVNYFDYIFESDELFLVMEFVNGVTLRKLIGDLREKKAKLNTAQSLYIVSEVAGGLDHAHSSVDAITHNRLNIIHRDINPHNIMLGFDGSIKIIDFGIAKADSQVDTTKVGTIKGKFSYMSPEQASAKPIDSRTDIYALGIVLWELLTGKKLHEGKNDLETLKKIRATVVPSPREIDPRISVEIEKVVMKALEKDPNSRYQKATDLRYDLNQLLLTQFSDFRPTEFSELMRAVYADTIKSRVEKLTYFAQLKFSQQSLFSPPPPPPPSSEPSRRSSERREDTSKTDIELPEGFESKTVTRRKEKLDFEELKYEENIFGAEVKMQSKQKAANFFAEPKSIEEEEPKDVDFKRILENSILWNLKHLALILVIIYAGFSFYLQFVNPRVSPAAKTSSASIEEKNSEGPTVALDLSQKTNANYRKVASVPQQQLEGFSYLNIMVDRRYARDTHIYIDGKLIPETTALNRLPVPSNKSVTVKAYNFKSNLYDEKKVMAHSGKVWDVQINLKPKK